MRQKLLEGEFERVETLKIIKFRVQESQEPRTKGATHLIRDRERPRLFAGCCTVGRQALTLLTSLAITTLPPSTTGSNP
ncbi:MAG: hypothetical protein Q4D38_00805 [Planctomycetia bacterium]|nr:hypothetical protein [Planctomycetia bacterium]